MGLSSNLSKSVTAANSLWFYTYKSEILHNSNTIIMNMNMSMDSGKGGFLNDTQSFSGDKSVKRAQNIVPVMIGQILRSSGDFQIWGIPARILTFLGILRSVNESTTKITYEVEDDTGIITALRWLEANKTMSEPSLVINSYVKVVGLLRDQNGSKQVFVLRISPLEDLNELTNHLLEVTYVTIKTEQLYKGKNADNLPLNLDESMKTTNDCSGMSPEQATIFNIIQADTSDSGIERSVVKARTPAHILRDVDKIIHFLISEGHIYTTCTDDHFKAT